jgi:polar amino acid transport system substrate-binding protein
MTARRLFASASTLIALTAMPLLAHADQLADIKAKGTLVCGVLGTDAPNSFVDPSTREIVGYEVDLCNAIAKKIGVKPVIKQMAVAARIPELQQGRIDILAASMTHNKEREPLLDFSLTTFVAGQKVMVRKTGGITQLSQLAGKKVLTVKGGTQEPNIRRAVPTVDVITYETAAQAFVALQQGKGSGYVNDEGSLLENYAKLGEAQKDYVILPQSISKESLALGIRKGEKGVKTVVDDTLRELEKSGQADKLFTKWFGVDSPLKFPKRWFTFSSDQV